MRRATIIGIAAGSAALLAVAGTVLWFLLRPAGPRDAAEDYLAALADGDGPAALMLVEGLPADADDLAAAFAAADATIAAPVVDDVTETGDAASATVAFELAGAERTATFSLVRSATGWRVAADALGTATATTTLGDTVMIAQVAAPAGEAQPLLPAAYTVRAAPVGILGGDAAITVLPGEDVEAAIDARVLDEATTVGQEQLDAYADECAAVTDAVPDACGIRIPWAADLETLAAVAFRIDEYPQLSLSDDATTFTASDGVLVATVTGESRAGGTASITYRTTQWTLRGDVSFSGGQMVLAVR